MTWCLQQVAEKRHLQLQQYDAPTSETAPWKPELDKDFSKPRREATFVKDAQVDCSAVIKLPWTPPFQKSTPLPSIYNHLKKAREFFCYYRSACGGFTEEMFS